MRDLITHYKKQVREYEEYLKFAETRGFRLMQITQSGETDVTEQHRQSLRDARDDYMKAIEYFRDK